MRISFILPEAGLAGGVRVAAIYAERLSRRGHDVCVVSLPRPRPTTRQRASALIKQGRWMSDTRQASHLDGLDVDHRIIDRRRPIEDRDVPDGDVVIATWWETAEWVAKLSASKGRKVYFCQHDETHLDARARRVDATYAQPMLQICVSQWVADEIRARHARARQVVLPNAVDTTLFHRRQRGRNNPFTVGFMYSTLASKGSDIALAALTHARREGLELNVLSFGHAAPPAGALADGDRFELQPQQQRIADIYGACDAWLFTSRVEGFGLPILEAMACGTPVIATPAGAAPELLAHGGGILAPQHDAVAIAQAIHQVEGMSEVKWKQMSNDAHATASAYTWDDATDLFEASLHHELQLATPTPLRRAHFSEPAIA